ncbi:aminotransferase class V-fold PLP-dependent enzyme, partial [bacterium]|nr:aminotransferase class V-fold PLP-dependent enzyme [bacterium]
TGVRSAERAHLAEYPYRLEAGTLNTVGIVGLAAGLAWVRERGVAAVRAHEAALADRFLAGLADLRARGRIALAGFAPDEEAVLGPERLAVVSLTVADREPEAVGLFLDADWNVAVRTGLQCAPLAHAALGTAPQGTVRFAFGPFNTPAHVDHALAALAALAG